MNVRKYYDVNNLITIFFSKYFLEQQLVFMSTATRSIAVLMLVGMFVQINSILVYYRLFYLNQKAIAETLCEKKTIDCCGQCFLHKKIALATDTQSASTEKSAQPKTLEELLNVAPGLLPETQRIHLPFSTGHTFTTGPASFLLDGIILQIDHPPNA